jgi:hypothetical protein
MCGIGNAQLNDKMNLNNVLYLKNYILAKNKNSNNNSKYHLSNYVSFEKLLDGYRQYIKSIDQHSNEPYDFSEAIKFGKWKKDMLVELNALRNNDTWDIVDKPKDKKIIGCRWLYKIKYKEDGSIECYKAHLVVQGFV